MTIALYIRVSTDEQATHGYSIEGQSQSLIHYCESQGWHDYKLYIDDGYTGTNLNRPQMKRLLRHIEQGKIARVIVHKLDRLSRRQRDILHLIEDVFEPASVAFGSATEPFDTGTPLGKAMIGILSVFAQLERDTIVERTRSGKVSRMRKGFWPGGRRPLGYMWDREAQTLQIIPHEADLVRGVYKQFNGGKSLVQIGEWLASRTQQRTPTHTYIRNMVSRPTYAGLVKIGDELVEGRHDAIIDLETWKIAQTKLEERDKGRKPYGKYLLSRIGVCGVCGASLKHQVNSRVTRYGGKWTYYMCSNRHLNGKEACPDSRYYNAKKLEDAVGVRIKQVDVNRQYILAELESNDSNDDNVQSLLDDLTTQLQHVNAQLENISDAIAQGLISKNLRERMQQLETERETLENRIDEVEAEAPSEGDPDAMLELLTALGEEWDHLAYEEQCQLLRDAVEKVIVYPDYSMDFVWNTP